MDIYMEFTLCIRINCQMFVGLFHAWQRVPAAGDSISLMCLVLQIDWTYAFKTTVNIMWASAMSASG